jgi:hypothetical protein
MPFVPIPVRGPVSLPIALIVTLVNAATTTGTAASTQFGFQPKPSGDYQFVLQAVKTAVTVCIVDVEISMDQGVTYNPWSAGLDFNANPVIRISQFMFPGPLFQLNVKKFTGTAVTINGAMN